MRFSKEADSYWTYSKSTPCLGTMPSRRRGEAMPRNAQASVHLSPTEIPRQIQRTAPAASPRAMHSGEGQFSTQNARACLLCKHDGKSGRKAAHAGKSSKRTKRLGASRGASSASNTRPPRRIKDTPTLAAPIVGGGARNTLRERRPQPPRGGRISFPH